MNGSWRLLSAAASVVVCLGIAFAMKADAQALQFYWNFDQLQNGAAVSEGAAKSPIRLPKPSENGGVGGTGAVTCGPSITTAVYSFPKLKYTAATIELSFKPTAPVKGGVTLLSYAESSYGRGLFEVFLKDSKHVGAHFIVMDAGGNKLEKQVELLSVEHEFAQDAWHTVRVTMEQGGAMKLYFNGRLDKMEATGGMCFAGLTGTVPPNYPILAIGSRTWGETASWCFTGLVDDVRIWNGVVEPGAEGQPPAPKPEAGKPAASVQPAASSGEAVIVSRRCVAPPAVDGNLDDACWKEAERTRPFAVLSKAHPTIIGLQLEADPKFVTAAASAQVCHDDKNLYIAYRAPAPEDVPAKAAVKDHDGRVWADDCVELFLDPMRRGGFNQILVNAIGTMTDAVSPPGTGAFDTKWESGAQVAVRRDGPGYTVEMAIPFASLGADPHSTGVAWGANFTREGASCGGASTWAPVGHSFDAPQRFGLLIFESRAAYHMNELARLEKELAGLPAERSPELANLAQAKLAALRRRIETDGDRASSWTPLRNATDELAGVVQQVAMAGRTYILWQDDIWASHTPDEKVKSDVKELAEINLLAGQNTFVQTGFMVSNLSLKPLLGRLLAEDPAEGAPLPQGAKLLGRERIELRRGVYVELSGGGMTPDALAELPTCNLVEVPARMTSLVWVKIDTHGLEPGKYARRMKFYPSYSGFKPTYFNISLEVAPVDLARPHVKQFAYLNLGKAVTMPEIVEHLVRYGVNQIEFIPGQLDAFPEFDAEGNIVSMNFDSLDKAIGLFVAAGVPKERVGVVFYLITSDPYYRSLPSKKSRLTYGTDAWKKGFAGWLKATRDHMFEKGYSYNDFCFYMVDEACGSPDDPNSTTHFALEVVQHVKDVDPRLRVMDNPSMQGEDAKNLPVYLKTHDILEPYRPFLQANPALIKELARSGREIWTYHILSKDMAPAVYRNLSWQSARDGFTGCCPYWAYLDRTSDPFDSYDGRSYRPTQTADYTVLYEDVEAKRIMPSRRLEAWYQGQQDYRLVALCRDLAARLQAAGKDAASYQRTIDEAISAAVDQPSGEMDAARGRLIRAAVEMQTKLGM